MQRIGLAVVPALSISASFDIEAQVETKNIAIEYRGTEGDLTRLPDLAAELVQLKVDVIVAPTTNAALAAKNATRSIPIVMVYIADPVAAGLVASLARPGGNITGLSWGAIELSRKQLQLLKETVPRLSTLAVLTRPSQFHRQVVKDVETSTRTLGLHLQILEVREPAEFDTAFSTMRRLRAEPGARRSWWLSPASAVRSRSDSVS